MRICHHQSINLHCDNIVLGGFYLIVLMSFNVQHRSVLDKAEQVLKDSKFEIYDVNAQTKAIDNFHTIHCLIS